ncbi:MAG: 16S rRNA (cytosine(1402)-N(4))-methyltransferase RsmH [Clostridiales bacterium]|jgi:16S rRNA (cytosine1402-N4)-methyltransferase|nr:16S rRNA (cytosine(1402)-N(4))-methyltransferase RsmH [Clostridiales bacterium]
MKHIPVLLKESIDNLKIKPDGIYVDSTVGCGGHAEVIASKLSRQGKLICVDRDEIAIKEAKKKLVNFNCEIYFFHDNFYNISNICCCADGILFDLGICSLQISDCNRGFSYINDGPLDMRMDKRDRVTAFEIINNFPEKALNKIIKEYGEERFYKLIVKKILDYRSKKKIESTLEFADIIKNAVPKKILYKSNPAKKTFQAIRIFVNYELSILEESIIKSSSILNNQGKICVITFHSLEDRIIKHSFKKICLDDKNFDIVTKKAIYPCLEEINSNSRSHSAKLRVLEKK